MSSQRGGEGGGGRCIGRDCDISHKIAVKFPTPGQKCEVKYNWNSLPRSQLREKLKYPYPRESKIIQMPYPWAKEIGGGVPLGHHHQG